MKRINEGAPLIKFGTDGWRGKIAEDFTFENVRIVAQATVGWLKENGLDARGAAVGYDNRFQSENFAQAAAEIFSGAGIKTYLSCCSIPSPTLSFAVNKMRLGGGIMITASHNPPAWNGYKIKENFGGSAFPATTKSIESKIENELRISPDKSNIIEFDPRPDYLKNISSLVDLEAIKSHCLKTVVDPMHGSGAGILKALGLPLFEIRGNRDPLFGGVNPEPLPVNLEDSISFTKEIALKYSSEITACIVLDGDADRIAAIDGTGKFINTHNVFALLLYHLAVNRKLDGNIVKTFNVSSLIDRLCKKFQRKLDITPIGFKYIAEKMLSEDVLLGGEESGGMGIKGFIPERDGNLAGLMLLELMAYEKQSLGQILETLMRENGFFFYDRIDLHTTRGPEIVSRLKQSAAEKFAGRKISKVETLDGLKLYFEDESWILFRASGTEPLLRIYVEAKNQEEVKALLSAGENLSIQ